MYINRSISSRAKRFYFK